MRHEWLKDAVFYEVYPQSFQDSNADGIGDFAGIVSRLDHIANLGCNAIWINPCFDSSFYDAGYDVRDYYKTAARYGSNADLRNLFDEAHRRGIRVLLDLVPGHTAVDNPWFAESCKDERNAWTDRYIWRPMTQSPDLNSPYQSIRGFMGGIAERPDAAAVNCFSTQVCLNYGFGTVTEDWQFAADSPEAEGGRLLLEDIMDFWLGLGCDGFRVDMAASLVKEDTPDHQWTSLLWRRIREHLDRTHPDAVLVSEWGNPQEALHAGFDMDFLLHFGPSHYLDLFRENPWFSAAAAAAGTGNVREFVDAYRAMADGTAGKGYICIPSGNHDMVRMRDTLTPDEMKLAFAFLMTMPGCPFVYYGDEIGMAYVHGLRSKEGGYERTGARTPMQWDDSTNAGFSAARRGDLYLPLDDGTDHADLADTGERIAARLRDGDTSAVSTENAGSSENAGSVATAGGTSATAATSNATSDAVAAAATRVGTAAARPNVAAQTGDPSSLLETVRSLIALRHAHPALQADSDVRFLYVEDHAYPLVYERTAQAAGCAAGTAAADNPDGAADADTITAAAGERIVVAINPSGTDATCPLESAPGAVLHVVSHSPANAASATWTNGTLTVPAGSATIFVA
ncbi:alpha-amylase family glycosyl hydrolase [Bifidobacterium biavatii]|uniref:Alpha-amylase n=1 Tax=Bifidobacterium biavatii DSM 23969 TaxID=1437608 RepID=A0A086ZNJ6_9BIFI|nr:alpha-amylase family glycosyl hydrolase [Bifidobacterium biavatii]KFI48096.1 alpha-amylase [Bifidobacterium biavatii DSM 23969]